MTRRNLIGASTGIVLTSAAAARGEAADDATVVKMLDDFAAAWNRHDVDGLMA